MSLEDVAKEVGLTRILKGNVVVMVTTGCIREQARALANKVMADSIPCIAMINGSDLAEIESNPVVIIDALNRESRQAIALKKLEDWNDYSKSSSGRSAHVPSNRAWTDRPWRQLGDIIFASIRFR